MTSPAYSLKRCTICGEEKPLDEFHLIRKGGTRRRAMCSTCNTLKMRAYREANRERVRDYGREYYGSKGPTYVSWRAMRERCQNPNHAGTEDYMARGITCCDRWASFENFLADMGERPDGTTLDRIDNDRGYEPGNCRWATHAEQANNRRPRRWQKRPPRAKAS